MAPKKILELKSATKLVRVVWVKAWEEYQVWLYDVCACGEAKINRPATYHTDNKDDAIGTARHMLATTTDS